nr:hypothetical protein [Tanacetum cinerariifolium]
MRGVGKGFSGVETSLFEGMLVAQEVGEGVADAEHDEGVPAAGVVTEGDVSVVNDEVPKVRSTTTSRRRPARVMVEYIFYEAQD